VMTAHIALPHLAASETVPATLSHEIITGLLREQLGYTGAVVTDCLEMDAIAAGIGVADGAVQALQAGADLVLVSHRDERQRAALDATEQALAAGTLPMEAIRAAAARVLALKSRFLSWDRLPDASNLAAVGTPEHQQLAERAYAEVVTVVRDEQKLLPLHLKEEQMLLIVGPGKASVSQAVDISWSVSDMLDAIRTRHANVASYLATPSASAGERDDLHSAIAQADVIFAFTINANLDPFQAAWVNELAQSGKPVIGIAAAVPYDAAKFPQIGTYLATYEYTVPALAVAVRVLFGEQPARGKLPVTLS
jgi:beta-N-acetylhexosaminidase